LPLYSNVCSTSEYNRHRSFHHAISFSNFTPNRFLHGVKIARKNTIQKRIVISANLLRRGAKTTKTAK